MDPSWLVQLERQISSNAIGKSPLKALYVMPGRKLTREQWSRLFECLSSARSSELRSLTIPSGHKLDQDLIILLADSLMKRFLVSSDVSVLDYLSFGSSQEDLLVFLRHFTRQLEINDTLTFEKTLVGVLDVENKQISSDTLTQLINAPYLCHELRAARNPIIDLVLPSTSGCVIAIKSLKCLDLSACPLSEQAILEISRLTSGSLEKLVLWDVEMSGSALEKLFSSNFMSSLSLFYYSPPQDSLDPDGKALAKMFQFSGMQLNLGNVEDLRFKRCSFDSQSLASILCACKCLQVFEMSEALHLFDSDTLVHSTLNNVPTVWQVNLSSNHLCDRGLQSLLSTFNNVREVNLMGNKITTLPACISETLVKLDLACNPMTSHDHLKIIPDIYPNLEQLGLGGIEHIVEEIVEMESKVPYSIIY